MLSTVQRKFIAQICGINSVPYDPYTIIRTDKGVFCYPGVPGMSEELDPDGS